MNLIMNMILVWLNLNLVDKIRIIIHEKKLNLDELTESYFKVADLRLLKKDIYSERILKLMGPFYKKAILTHFY
jgi:hypothetical protein